MRFPTREQCLRWYKELGTPQNIIDHVIAVNKVAVFLCKKLKEKGYGGKFIVPAPKPTIL